MADPISGTISAIHPRTTSRDDAAEHDRTLFALGNADLLANRPSSALTAYRRAIALCPHAIWLLSNAAEALAQLNEVSNAVAWQRRALAVTRGAAKVLANLAHALTRLDQPDAGLSEARAAICLEPALSAAHVNHGLAATTLDLQSYAELFFRRALAIAPESAEASFALATVRLKAGDLLQGFRLYEHRLRLASMRSAGEQWPAPMWNGRFVPGLRLLLWCEQGFGDAIHFVRYAPILARHGIKIVLATPAPLKRLFSCLEPQIQICGLDDTPPVDVQLPLMSLPHLLKTDLGDIPSATPYLSRVTAEGNPAAARGGPLRVGFVWAGRPEYSLDRIRSIPPDLVPSLVSALSTSGGELHSLQIGPRQRDLAGLQTPIVDHGESLHDFADTADAILRMDLVVSSDSAVSHLAGALGRPTWVLLAYSAEWRWLEGRSDSPWYPSARLYRQPRRGDWDAVIWSVARDLAAWRSGVR